MQANTIDGRTTPGVHDRAALEGAIDGYLDALAANDPSRLKLAKGSTFVENYQPLQLGEGVWRTITGRGSYSHYFADPETSQAGFIGTVRENGVGAMLDIRLKLDDDGRIGEIETFIIRDALACERLEAMGKPEGVWPGRRG